jgi:hydrogenase-4 component B
MLFLLIGAVALLLGAAASLVLRQNRARVGASIGAQVVASVFTLAAVVPVFATGTPLSAEIAWSYPVGTIAFRVDALSAFFLAWSLPLTLLGTIYAGTYLRPDLSGGRNPGSHVALLDLLSLSFLLIYAAQDALVFLLGWEVAAVCAWLLVIWSYRSQKIRFAGFNYLVSTHVGLFVIAAAFMTLRAQAHSMDFAAFGASLSTPGALRDVTFGLLCVAFALKSGFFPFHTWVPRAESAAPAHVSALMSGVIHKAGLFGFLRFTLLLGVPEEWMGWTILAFGATSAVVGALFTTTQRDLKRLLGYSSTENVGIAAMGFGVGYLGLTWHRGELVALGFGAGLLHILNHALFKCLLFYGAGAVSRGADTVDLEHLGGLARAMPRTAALFLIGGLATAGLPPLNGFASEFLLYAALLRSGASGNAAAALIAFGACLAFSGAVSAFAVVRAFGVAFLGTPRAPLAAVPADPGWGMLAPMALHAVAIALLGLVPTLGLALVTPALRLFGPPGTSEAPAAALLTNVGTANLLLAAGIAVPVAVGLWLARRGTVEARAPIPTWGCGYPAATPRMQVTATSFAAPFARLFAAWIPPVVKRVLPQAYFPAGPGLVRSHPADPVEDRIFEGLGEGEKRVTDAFGRVSAEPRAVFAVGLVMLVVLAYLAGGTA